MAKRIIEDVIRKKIKRVPAPEAPQKPPQEPKAPGKKSSKKIYFFVFLVLAVILGAGFVLIKFSSANIKITPRQQVINIDAVFDNLSFEIIQMAKKNSLSFNATGISKGGQSARGTIVLYNTYSSKGQYLLIDTRLSTPDGKIYKTEKAVTIPGNGSVEVGVYADKPGPDCNIGLTDFSIVGFKGTAKYDKIYGRSKTFMTGGALGDTVVATDADINNAKNSLESQLTDYFFEQMNKQKPTEYLLYKNALATDFVEEVGKNFSFIASATSTGFLIKKDGLSGALVKKYLSQNGEDNSSVYVSNLEDLNFNLVSKNNDNTKMTFEIKGDANFVWKTDEEKLTNDLMLVNNGDYASVFQNYPNIEKAEIIFSPSWWRYLPSDKSRIHFETVLQ